MAELADALDLGSSGESRAGSTPVIRTWEGRAVCPFVILNYNLSGVLQ